MPAQLAETTVRPYPKGEIIPGIDPGERQFLEGYNYQIYPIVLDPVYHQGGTGNCGGSSDNNGFSQTGTQVNIPGSPLGLF